MAKPKEPMPVAGAGANTIDPQKALSLVKQVESFNAKIEEIRGEMGGKINAVMSRRAEVYAKAKEDGISPKALKGIVKKRDLERKINAIPAKLEEDDSEAYKQLEQALGPLGAAARAAREKEAKAETGKRERAKPLTSEESPTDAEIAAKRKAVTEEEQKAFDEADPKKAASANVVPLHS